MIFLIQRNLNVIPDLELYKAMLLSGERVKRSDPIINALNDISLPYTLFDIIPFSEVLPDNLPVDCIPIGSTLLSTLAYNTKEWSGLYFDVDLFTYSMAIANRDDMLNEGVITVEHAISFFKSCDKDSQWFVRPDNDLKQFTGTVITAEEGIEWFESMVECASTGSYQISLDTYVVVSKPKRIDAEYRFFIVDNKVVTGSLYKENDILKSVLIDTSDELFHIATKMAQKWLPSPCCVMDIAKIDNDYKVIEFNCINSSGYYDSDIKTVLQSIYDYTTKE